MDNKKVNFMGCEFVLGKSKKFDSDFNTVSGILSKDTVTDIDRLVLIGIYKESFHDDGKIEGTTSFDSSCHGCEFCKHMMDSANGNANHICNYCYDYKQENYRMNVRNRHQLNMLIMSSVLFTENELAKLNASAINRVNSSGDTPNEIYAENMIRLAKINPYVKFGYWAKNARPIIAVCERIGKPDNLSLVYSSPIINHVCNVPKYFDYVFTVCSTPEKVSEMLANGGCECNGRKCKECGYACYTKAWENGSVIVELLRASKKQVYEIEKAGV